MSYSERAGGTVNVMLALQNFYNRPLKFLNVEGVKNKVFVYGPLRDKTEDDTLGKSHKA